MNLVQQQLSINQSDNEQIEKLQLATPDIGSSQGMSIGCIEDLPNEFFYEVLDYLDGYHIYKAFSNLNYRFRQLLNSSSFLFKIHFRSTSDETSIKHYKQMTSLYRHQIFSLDVCFSSQKDNHFFSSFSMDSSYDHLESLVLNRIRPNMLTSLLTDLSCLPRLFLLTIYGLYALKESNAVYPLVFALPKLRYARLLLDVSRYSSITVLLPPATNKQFSTIEHLVIDHPCTFGELFVLLSYTPQLRRLKFNRRRDNNSSIRMVSPIILSYLTSISIYGYYITFDELEMFITKLDCELKVLCVTTKQSEDMSYLNADRWKRLILQYTPQLKEFHLKYIKRSKRTHNEFDFVPYIADPDEFTSAFWIERKWVLAIDLTPFKIVYSIHPYKKRWYDINSSTEMLTSVRLTLSDIRFVVDLVLFTNNIRDCLPLAYIYHLEIPGDKIFFGTLSDIVQALPELDSLKVSSLSSSPTTYLSMEEKSLRPVSDKSRITKVYLENMTEIEDIDFLMKLCPRMAYLQVNCINSLDVESVVSDILMKMNMNCHQHLRSLCFRVPTADDKMINRLEEMINSQKLLPYYLITRPYTIKRVLDNIYLEWQ